MRRTCVLPYEVSSAALARRQVERFAMEQNLDGETEALRIIVSELVANAVLHGAEPVELTLCHELDEVTVEVSDGDPAVNNVRSPVTNERAAGGRGLVVVAALSRRWGTRPSRNGKTVWAIVQQDH